MSFSRAAERVAREVLREAQSIATLDMQRKGQLPSEEESSAIRSSASLLEREIQRMSGEISTLHQILATTPRRLSILGRIRSVLVMPRRRAKLEVRLESLYQIQEQMVAQLVVHRWLIAPVRRLPVELLSKIFLHLLDMLVEQPPNDVDISVALEYTIVNVCEAWRFAAYGTPHLWTHIECPPSKVLEPYFQHFLPLSGELPLSLYSCRRADMLAPFLEHMRPYAHRWGTLSLYGSPDDLTGLDPIRAPQLLSIEINFKSSYASNPYEPLNFIGDAPRLQRLLMNLPNVYQLISIPVAASLTWLELSFGAFHVYYVLPILEQSARMLQHFGFSVSCDLPEQRTHFTRSVGLPALTSLSLQGKTASLLTFISAPFLSEISVDGPPAVMPGCLLEFLQQTPLTGENLRALRLTGKKLAPKDEDVENLTQCFACMSDLKELSLSTPPPAPLVQALVCRDDAYPLLPNLRNALFECIAPTRRMHMEFLRSRDESRTILGTHVAALESFRLDTTEEERENKVWGWLARVE